MTIAIIGAGMAGLSCAGALQAAGIDVRLYDKGRGPGGRMSTRRADTVLGELRWDHGAQFFTAKSGAFQSAVAEWRAAGIVAEWTGRFAEVAADGSLSPAPSKSRFVGAPSMNAVIRHMASGLDVAWARRVSGIEGTPGAWTLTFEDGASEGPFEAVISAVPAEQAVGLLEQPAPRLAQEAEAVRSAPCWAVMLAFSSPVEAGFDAASLSSGPLSWVARNASKPGRGDADTWVLHASSDWSRAHLEENAGAVATTLTAHFRALTGAPEPVYQAAHRWRYSQIEQGAGSPYGWDAAQAIGTIGDWRTGPRVELAWQSGQALAGILITAQKQL